MDNAEFDNGMGSGAVTRILRRFLDSLTWGTDITPQNDGPLYDFNGHKVGSVKVSK
jgi:hypothetical protein